MGIDVSYLGMSLEVSDLDQENLRYFHHCAQGIFHLQRCTGCALLRYPPGPSCPACGEADSCWAPVAMTGTVHSFTEVHHAIQPGFRDASPYAVLIVELDDQRGVPTADAALRVVGNLVDADGRLAPADQVARVGIGSRVRMAFTPLGPDIAIPNWSLLEASGHTPPWRPD